MSPVAMTNNGFATRRVRRANNAPIERFRTTPLWDPTECGTRCWKLGERRGGYRRAGIHEQVRNDPVGVTPMHDNPWPRRLSRLPRTRFTMRA